MSSDIILSARSALGYEPVVGLEQVIIETIEFYQSRGAEDAALVARRD